MQVSVQTDGEAIFPPCGVGRQMLYLSCLPCYALVVFELSEGSPALQKELELAEQIRKYSTKSPFKAMKDGGEKVASTIEAQAARIAELEAVLQRFVYWADAYENHPEMSDHPMMADLRALKAATEKMSKAR